MEKITLIILCLISLTSFSKEKITFGHETNEQIYSSVISIRKNKKHYCTGTLVRRNLILTASHCLKASFQTPQELSILYNNKLREVESLLIHPGHLFSKKFDVGLIVLQEKINDEDLILARIPSEEQVLKLLYNFDKFTVVGYGVSETGSLGKKKKVTLKRKEINAIEFSLTGENGKDSCSGDSGGPALKVLNGTPFIVGVVKSGNRLSIKNCGEGGLYTFSSKANTLLDFYDEKEKNPFKLNLGSNTSKEKALIMLHELQFSYFDNSTLEAMKKDYKKFSNVIKDTNLKLLVEFKLERKLNPFKKIDLTKLQFLNDKEYYYPLFYEYALATLDREAIDFLFDKNQKITTRLTRSYKIKHTYYAKKSFDMLVKLTGELQDFRDPILLELEALGYYVIGDFDIALKKINEAIELFKYDNAFYITKKKILKQLGQSQRENNKLIKKTDVRNSLYKANALKTSNPHQAIRLVNSIKSLKGYDYEKLSILGAAYLSLDEFKMAINYFLNAYRVSGNTRALREVYLINRYDLGNKRAALKFLSKILVDEPSAYNFFKRAKFYRELKMMDKAKEDLERARELAPYETWSL